MKPIPTRPQALTLAALLLGASLLAGCTAQRAPVCTPRADAPGAEPVCFLTSDGWIIHGAHWDTNNTDAPTVLLLHGFREDHNAYNQLAQDLNQHNQTPHRVLAIDLRGHGASTNNTRGPDKSWGMLETADVYQMRNDVDAAQRFLQGPPTAIVGASLGANLGLDHAASTNQTPNLLLLSPIAGKGPLDPTEPNQRYNGSIFYAASHNDNPSVQITKTLYQNRNRTTDALRLYNGSAHGTQLLDEPTIRETLTDWLTQAPAPADPPTGNQTPHNHTNQTQNSTR